MKQLMALLVMVIVSGCQLDTTVISGTVYEIRLLCNTETVTKVVGGHPSSSDAVGRAVTGGVVGHLVGGSLAWAAVGAALGASTAHRTSAVEGKIEIVRVEGLSDAVVVLKVDGTGELRTFSKGLIPSFVCCLRVGDHLTLKHRDCCDASGVWRVQ